MRAISCYLLLIGEWEDAVQEATDLLEAAPYWHLSPNQMGFCHGSILELDKALPYYTKAAHLTQTHYIGFYNLSCIYSLKNELDLAVEYLKKIVDNDAMVSSIREAHTRLSHDSDFRNVAVDEVYGSQFRALELELFPEAPEIDWNNDENSTYYTY